MPELLNFSYHFRVYPPLPTNAAPLRANSVNFTLIFFPNNTWIHECLVNWETFLLEKLQINAKTSNTIITDGSGILYLKLSQILSRILIVLKIL